MKKVIVISVFAVIIALTILAICIFPIKTEITKGLFTKYVEGYAEIGEEQYRVSSVSFDYDGPGIAAAFTRDPRRLSASSMYISDDGTYFMLTISENDEINGVWLNCSDFGDYKKAMKYFYQHLDLQ